MISIFTAVFLFALFALFVLYMAPLYSVHALSYVNLCEEPSPPEQCNYNIGTYMGLDSKGNLIFTSSPTGQSISVYSVVQKNIDKKKMDFDKGIFNGYNLGLNDGKQGLKAHPSPDLKSSTEYKAGFNSGYSDGYAAGEFLRHFEKPK